MAKALPLLLVALFLWAIPSQAPAMLYTWNRSGFTPENVSTNYQVTSDNATVQVNFYVSLTGFTITDISGPGYNVGTATFTGTYSRLGGPEYIYVTNSDTGTVMASTIINNSTNGDTALGSSLSVTNTPILTGASSGSLTWSSPSPSSNQEIGGLTAGLAAGPVTKGVFSFYAPKGNYTISFVAPGQYFDSSMGIGSDPVDGGVAITTTNAGYANVIDVASITNVPISTLPQGSLTVSKPQDGANGVTLNWKITPP